jgi:hypothetical protein
MKYLLFVYYSEGEKTEDEIHQIATELSPIVDSDEIKYVYGPAHVVFNFMTEMSLDELSIYVGQVDYEASPEELRGHFSPCGTINRVTIMCDKLSGQPKGYKFFYIKFIF